LLLSWQAIGLSQSINDWVNTVGGSWETAGNWSLGAPSSAQTASITNAPSKIIYLQGFPPVSTLTVSNLIISGPAGQTNTLQLSSLSSGTFVIQDGLSINNGGAVRVLNGSAMQVDNVYGGGIRVDGELSMSGGLLVTTSAWFAVGYNGQGQMSIGGGSLLARSVNPGYNSGTVGTITFAGGAHTFTDGPWAGFGVGSTGVVWVTGGQVSAFTRTVVGYQGFGQMIVSNGVWQGNEWNLTVGYLAGSVGNFSMAAGSASFTGVVYVGRLAGATGTVSVTGGTLAATNNPVYIGGPGVGTLTVSGGALTVNTLQVASNGFLSVSGGSLVTTTAGVLNAQATIVGDAQQTATWTMQGGSHVFSNELRLGSSTGSTGIVFLTGGTLATPNVYAAIGGSGIGRMDVSNGLWQAYQTEVGLVAGSSGTLTIAGGTNIISYWLTVGDNSTGMVRLTDGLLVVNNTTCLGYQTQGVGQVVVTGGTWSNAQLIVGNTSRARGGLTLQGGTTVINGEFKIQGATGTVVVAGGQLIANSTTYLSYSAVHSGQMIVSNGTWQGQEMYVGRWSVGTLTIAGGASSLNGHLRIGYDTVATGSLWVTGGQLVSTNGTNYVGYAGCGRATVSNGLWMARDVMVSYWGAGSSGTLTVAGGTNVLSGDFIVGFGSGGTCTGFVWLTGGQLVTTNATAYLGRRQGQLTVSNAAWLAGNVNLGYFGSSVGTLTVAGGSVAVGPDAALNVLRGALNISGGTTTVERLALTNGATSLLSFTAGTLASRGTVVSNGAAFIVGNGVLSATYRMDGGDHSFGNSLLISPSAQLLGNGIIRGLFINKSAVYAGYTGDTLTVVGAVTNSGSITALTGASLVFSNPVVNSGTIDASAGAWLTFASGVVNTGTIRQPQDTNLWTSGANGKWETSGGWSLGFSPVAHHVVLITNSNPKTVTIDVATTNTPGTMSVSYLTVSAPVSFTNALVLIGSGLGQPLRVSTTLKFDGNGAGFVSNAAVFVGGDLVMSSRSNSLVVAGGSVVTNVNGTINSDANFILVTDNGSVWTNANWLTFGSSSVGNNLVISNGGALFSKWGAVGANASANNNTVLVTGSNSVWVSSMELEVGYYGVSNRLIVSDGGQVLTRDGMVGYNNSSSSQRDGHDNFAFVIGSNSLWRCTDWLTVGFCSSANSLTISNGGQVVSPNGYIGWDASVYNNSGHNNSVLITGNGSSWSNGNNFSVGYTGNGNQLTVGANASVVANNLYVGFSGAGNQLITTNGGVVQSVMIYVGRNGGNNSALITGTGSVWRTGHSVYAGFYGTGNQLTISDGGFVSDQFGILGNYNSSVNNTALVTGVGSLWSNTYLYVGVSGRNNQLTLASGGGAIASTLILGNNSDASGNQLTVSNGWLSVTDGASTGWLDARRGTLTLNGGTITVDNLTASNGASSGFVFAGGLLRSRGTTINKGSALTIGDGSQAATYVMDGGTHSFTNGLIVSPNAALTGNGTIVGTVTNSGNIAVSNGATMDFYSPVVNNGVINAILGTASFYGGLSGGGLYLDANGDADGDGMSNLKEVQSGTDPTNSASVLRVSSVGTIGNDVQINWSAVGGKSYVVQTNSTPSDAGFADFSPVISVPGSGATTTNYNDIGGATNFPARFYRVRLAP